LNTVDRAKNWHRRPSRRAVGSQATFIFRGGWLRGGFTGKLSKSMCKSTCREVRISGYTRD
jgi:hypothetical protein